MQEKINLAEKLGLVNEYWSPAVVGRLHDYKIQVVKVKEEFTWHTHDGTDVWSWSANWRSDCATAMSATAREKSWLPTWG